MLSVTGTGATLATALHHAYSALDNGVAFEGLHRRSDIGWRAAAPHRPVVVGILGSTNGTDFQYMLEASAKGQLPGVEFCVVVSSWRLNSILLSCCRCKSYVCLNSGPAIDNFNVTVFPMRYMLSHHNRSSFVILYVLNYVSHSTLFHLNPAYVR